jgi:CRP-like cAMP-binding protein
VRFRWPEFFGGLPILDRLSVLPHFCASEFGALDPDARAALDRAVTYRMLGPNEFIYLQEDEAHYLYFVRSGHVRLSYLLEDGSPILFGVLPPGESFGELGIFEAGRHADMATSIGTSSIWCVPAAAFRSLRTQHPELGAALARTVARRYRSYILLTRILGLKTLPARLSQCLLRVADGLNDRIAHGNRQVLQVGSFVTQSDLGLMARGARGNVNRALKAWERQGWIAMRDRNILILDRTSLEGVAIDDGLA